MSKAIVLGGYGLIGSAVMRALARAGFEVVGVGRSSAAAMASDAAAKWTFHDIGRMSTEEWRGLLAGVDVVINAAGALQSGLKDDLTRIHVTAIERLVEAARGRDLRIVQISAAGAAPDASTEFFATKGRGDAILAREAEDWVILRPTLVLSPDAYGGTGLLRGVAAAPLIVPRVLPEALVQTVHIDDLTTAVVSAARGEVPSGVRADLTEPEANVFPDLVAAVRRWLGFAPARFAPDLPGWALRAVGRGADLAGYLGWRPAMRSTALAVLAEGVRGDPDAWRVAGGKPCRPLAETLADLPATRQERLYARLFFALPLAIVILSLFWTLSGLITLIDPGRAVAVLTGRDAPIGFAHLAVFGGALADMILGLGILWRPRARLAALGMIGLSLAYLGGSVLFAPDLWADPLGPMLKVVPGIGLAALVWLMLDAR